MTPRHRAYEVWDEKYESFDAAPVDMWGLGVTLYKIMFQRFPFPDKKFGCLADTRYARYFCGQSEEDKMGFFSSFSSYIKTAPSQEPFEAIIGCLESDPEARIIMDDIASMPFFQQTDLTPTEEQELNVLLD